MLVTITGVLAGSIFVINLGFGRGLLEALLFALAIAVGLTPQLLPAIVTVSLATGARRLATKQVVVKRLVSIEDLGNVEVLFTDKTGTLTEGRIVFEQAVDPAGTESPDVLALGLAASDPTGNALDRALWDACSEREPGRANRTTVAEAPFDHERQVGSVLVDIGTERLLVTKGAPEAILARCARPNGAAAGVLEQFFAAGSRVVAVATRPAPELHAIGPDDERGLALRGFLAFADPRRQMLPRRSPAWPRSA